MHNTQFKPVVSRKKNPQMMFKSTDVCCLLFYVEQPPFFLEELQNMQVMEGEAALLFCELSKPGVSVLWKKGATRLRPGVKYEIRQNGCKLHLKIHDTTPQDSGSYKCCAGTFETMASLEVKGTWHFGRMRTVFNIKGIMYSNNQL